jgi:hypothetical protein
MTKENKIRLGTKVIVSDPCYEIPTWCQEVIKGVRPGVYDTDVEISDEGDWGERIASLTALHESCKDDPTWEHYSYNIGVDSGQAGIFCATSYRKDELAKSIPWLTEKGSPFKEGYQEIEVGDSWYEKMCDRTLNDKQWGTYDRGVVCSSGFGDGSYELLVSRQYGIINGFKIVFIQKDFEEEVWDDEYEDGYYDEI